MRSSNLKVWLAMRWLVLASVGLSSFGVPFAHANPTGGQVVAGSATVQTTGSTLTINQSSSRAIIDWQSFSIGNGETTKFIQPSSSSASLSRVISSDPSSLLGSLQSNGQVYLINPNGIVFGRGFQLNTAGFLASTLDVNNAQFMSGGNLTFSGTSTASIVNDGSLTTGNGGVFLFASTVENNGKIKSGGTVAMAGASDLLLATTGAQRVYIRAGSQPGTVINRGSIAAVSAELKAVGGNAGALAINNTGTIRVNGTQNRGGHIWLTASNGDIGNSGNLVARDAGGNGGTIDLTATSNQPSTTPATVYDSGTVDASGTATGAVGGTVQITGDQVALQAGSVVNVSGDSGGGTAMIGGGSHGTDAQVPNAQSTYIDPESQIIADALRTGNGGNVTVWSDTGTQYFGSISARGGAISGNGGNVEVSGGGLVFQGIVDTTAAHGSIGTLLLDPTDITITTADNNITPTSPFEPTGANSTVSWATLDAVGANVTVQTSASDPDNGQTGTINVEAGDWSTAGATLSLIAGAGPGSAIIIAGAVTDSGGGSFNLQANDGISVAPTGSLAATGAGTITANSGAGDFSVSGGGVISTEGGTMGITSGGNILVSGTGAISTASTGELDLTTTGASSVITQNTGASITAGFLSVQSAGAVTISGTANAITNVAVNDTGSGGVKIVDTTALTIDSVDGINGITSAGGSVNIKSEGMTLGSAATPSFINSGAGTILLSALGGSYQFNTGTVTTTSTLDSALEITAATAVALGNISAVNGQVDIGVQGGVSGQVTQNAGTTIVANSLLANTTANFALTNSGNQISEVAATITGAGNGFALTDSTPLTVTTLANPVTTSAVGITTISGAVALTTTGTVGTLTIDQAIDGGSGAVTLTSTGAIGLGANVTTEGGGGTAADITFDGAVNLLSSVTVTADGTADSGADIAFVQMVNGTSVAGQNLTVSTQSGNIDFDGVVGGGTRLGNITIVNSNSVDFGGAVTAATLTQQAGSGTTTFSGAIDLSGSIALTPALPALPVNYTGNATAPTDAALYLNTDNVTFNAAASTSTTATNGTGNVIIDNSGLLTMAEGADMGFNVRTGNTPALSGQFLQVGTGNVSMGNNITTQGDVVFFNGAVNFTSTSTTASLINTTGNSNHATGADILFNSALNGTTVVGVNGQNNLTLNAGTGGNIDFFASAGTTTNLGDLVIASADNVELNGNNITARDFYQPAGQGTTTIDAVLTTTANTANQVTTFIAMSTPTVAAKTINLPLMSSAGTGGGTQIDTAEIAVTGEIMAANGGEISLIATGASPTALSTPGAALLIASPATGAGGAIVDADGGGNIILQTTAATGADVDVTGGSQVETTGAGTGAITITSSDDFVLDGTGGITEGLVQTVNGNVTINVSNALPADNANGIVVEAGDDAAGVLVSAHGTLTLNANANHGELEILGGTANGSSATVTSTGVQTVTVAGGLTGASSNAILLQGGSGTGSSASLTTTDADASQSITVSGGDITVSAGTADSGAYAALSSGSIQVIGIAGNLNVWGSQASPGLAAGTANDDYAVVQAGIDQTITLGGRMAVDAFQGSSSGGVGPLSIAGLGATVVDTDSGSTNTQLITVNGTDANETSAAGAALSVVGGSSGIGNTGAEIEQAGLTTTGSDQRINVANGSLWLQGGTDGDSFARIDSQNTQEIGYASAVGIAHNITLQAGGSTGATGSYAALTSVADQSVIVAGNFNIFGSQASATLAPGAANDDYALVQTQADQTIRVGGQLSLDAFQGSSSGAAGALTSTGLGAAIVDANSGTTNTQLIVVNGANLNLSTVAGAALSLSGGSSGVGGTAAEIEQAGTTSDQQVNVTTGSIWIQGGTDSGAFVQIDSQNTQEIGDASPIKVNVTLEGGGSGSNAGAYAALTSASTQTIDVAGNLDIFGSQAASLLTPGAANDDYALIQTQADQTLTVGGRLALDAFQGSSSGITGPLGSAGFGAAVVDLDSGGTNSQLLTVSGSDTNLTTVSGAAFSLQGGSSGVGGTAAEIEQAGPTSDQFIDVPNGSVWLQGGADANAFARIDSQNTQEIGNAPGIGGNVTLQGGGAGANGGSYASLTAVGTQDLEILGNLTLLGSQGATATQNDDYALVQTQADQIVNVGDTVTVNALEGSSSGNAGQPLVTAGLGAAIIALDTQTNGSQTITISHEDLNVIGGDGSVGQNGAEILQADSTSLQSISLGGGTMTVAGGSDANAFALIDSANSQEIDVMGKDGSGNSVVVSGGTGTDATGILSAGSVQSIGTTANIAGNIVVEGGAGLDASAQVTAVTSQSIFTKGALSVLGSSTEGMGGGIARILLTDPTSSEAQTVNVSGAGGIQIVGGAGAGDVASIDLTGVTGEQSITATDGALVLDDGTGAGSDARIGSASTTAAFPFMAEQTVQSVGAITLDATNGNLALISSAGVQKITSSGGVLSLTGTGTGSEANITGVTSDLFIDGTGTSDWTGNAVIGTDGVTNFVQIQNVGAISIVDPPAGQVNVFANANPGVSTIFFDGAGKVASSTDRLVTETEIMNFNDPSATVDVDERQNGVGLEGSVGALNLITSDASAADINSVTNAGDFTANFVTITTGVGNSTSVAAIDLNDSDNAVATFGTISAGGTGSEFVYDGAPGVVLKGPVTATGLVQIDVGTSAITVNTSGLITSGGTQEYDSRVLLGCNSTLTAGTAGTATESIDFDNTLAGGVFSLTIAGGDARFMMGAGTVASPLYNLTLNAGTEGDFFAGTVTAPSLIAEHSYFNNGGTTTVTGNAVLIVDDGVEGPGTGVFQGGNIDIMAGSLPTFYVPNMLALTGTPVDGGLPFPMMQVYNAWLGAPYSLLLPFATDTVFYKGTPPPPRKFPRYPELTTFSLLDMYGSYYSSYQLGGTDGAPDGYGTPGTLAGLQQFPFEAVVNVGGYAPGQDDPGTVWLHRKRGALVAAASDPVLAGPRGRAFSADIHPRPKQLERKPDLNGAPQSESQGTTR